MTGWLIVNEYLNTEKFVELQKLFADAALKKNIRLLVYTNADFIVDVRHSAVVSDVFEDDNPDFIIFYDKDIALARAFEALGIKVFNSSDAIKTCDSKYLTFEKVAAFNLYTNEIDENYDYAGINVPTTYKVPFTYENIGIKGDNAFKFLDLIEERLCYPMIIKESYSSFGMGVHLAKNREEAERILSECGNRECVIQKYIGTDPKALSAVDVRLQMVGHKCVAAMKRSNENDFRANITNGGTMSAYIPSEDDLKLSVNVMDALGLDFAGIDIMHDGSRPVFCEANSNAHFKNLYDLTGINTAENMLDYIIDRLDEKEDV